MNMEFGSMQGQTDPGVELLRWVEQERIGKLLKFSKGQMLFWQGDPVEYIYLVKEGAIKIFSLYLDGKVYAYGILGVGGVCGVTNLLEERPYEAFAEVIEDAEVIAIAAREFKRLIAENTQFSLLIMKRLACEIRLLANKASDMAFFDVQKRLKRRLLELASEHGNVVDKGIRINLDLTHEEIAALVAANRSTITTILNELKEQGFLWREGRHFVVLSPDHMEILDELTRAVVDGEELAAKEYARKSVNLGVEPIKALHALSEGMKMIDRMYSRNEVDISDVILSAYAMKSALPIIEAELDRRGQKVRTIGKVVIGTVYGDVHDIGRTMVAMLLKARGFEIVDLGINVSVEEFIEAVLRHKPDILAMSSLMSTSVQEQFKVIRALNQAGLRHHVKVIVGGSAVTKKLSEQMGADGYEPTAHRAAELAWRLMYSA